jgi:hypothetical protein
MPSREAFAMRSTLVCAALLATLTVSASAFAQQPDQPQQPPVNQDKIKTPPASTSAGQTPPPAPPAQIGTQASGDSLAAAARKAREAKKDQAQAAPRVFDNDTIPKQGGVSAVGPTDNASSNAATDGTTSSSAPASGAAASLGPNDEKAWRERFARLRHKLQQDQDALDIMQRELGVLDVQYYNDPNKAMQQNLTRSDINAKTAKIDAGKQQVEADKQAISDAEDELRRAGGDIGWSR